MRVRDADRIKFTVESDRDARAFDRQMRLPEVGPHGQAKLARARVAVVGAGPVGEDRMLELEREAFLSLCGEPKSQERMQYMLMNNKPLRN